MCPQYWKVRVPYDTGSGLRRTGSVDEVLSAWLSFGREKYSTVARGCLVSVGEAGAEESGCCPFALLGLLSEPEAILPQTLLTEHPLILMKGTGHQGEQLRLLQEQPAVRCLLRTDGLLLVVLVLMWELRTRGRTAGWRTAFALESTAP